jgi:hypothetical protein
MSDLTALVGQYKDSDDGGDISSLVGKYKDSSPLPRFKTQAYRDAVHGMFKQGFSVDQVATMHPNWSRQAIEGEWQAYHAPQHTIDLSTIVQPEKPPTWEEIKKRTGSADIDAIIGHTLGPKQQKKPAKWTRDISSTPPVAPIYGALSASTHHQMNQTLEAAHLAPPADGPLPVNEEYPGLAQASAPLDDGSWRTPGVSRDADAVSMAMMDGNPELAAQMLAEMDPESRANVQRAVADDFRGEPSTAAGVDLPVLAVTGGLPALIAGAALSKAAPYVHNAGNALARNTVGRLPYVGPTASKIATGVGDLAYMLGTAEYTLPFQAATNPSETVKGLVHPYIAPKQAWHEDPVGAVFSWTLPILAAHGMMGGEAESVGGPKHVMGLESAVRMGDIEDLAAARRESVAHPFEFDQSGQAAWDEAAGRWNAGQDVGGLKSPTAGPLALPAPKPPRPEAVEALPPAGTILEPEQIEQAFAATARSSGAKLSEDGTTATITTPGDAAPPYLNTRYTMPDGHTVKVKSITKSGTIVYRDESTATTHKVKEADWQGARAPKTITLDMNDWARQRGYAPEEPTTALEAQPQPQAADLQQPTDRTAQIKQAIVGKALDHYDTGGDPVTALAAGRDEALEAINQFALMDSDQMSDYAQRFNSTPEALYNHLGFVHDALDQAHKDALSDAEAASRAVNDELGGVLFGNRRPAAMPAQRSQEPILRPEPQISTGEASAGPASVLSEHGTGGIPERNPAVQLSEGRSVEEVAGHYRDGEGGLEDQFLTDYQAHALHEHGETQDEFLDRIFCIGMVA